MRYVLGYNYYAFLNWIMGLAISYNPLFQVINTNFCSVDCLKAYDQYFVIAQTVLAESVCQVHFQYCRFSENPKLIRPDNGQSVAALL